MRKHISRRTAIRRHRERRMPTDTFFAVAFETKDNPTNKRGYHFGYRPTASILFTVSAKNLQDALNIAEGKFEEFLGSEIRGEFIMKQAEAI